MPIEVDQYVFVKHPNHSWVKAVVKRVEHSPHGLRKRKVGEVERLGENIYSCYLCKEDNERKESYNGVDVTTAFSDPHSELIEVDSEDMIYPWAEETQKEVTDLLSLVDLHEATLLETLRKRFFQDYIYTYIGPICIAMNPFKWTIPWYQLDSMNNYMQRAPNLPPHFWEIADQTYRDMVRGRGNQSILVSGNSGAGKTETVKQLIEYISNLSYEVNASRVGADQLKQKMIEISDMIRDSSPILEAFGNAKTINNDNSSRFGKFIQLQFDKDGAIAGAHITNYLLEKSRLCYQAEEERTYHIFYQFLAGASDDELRKYFLSRRPDKYKGVFGGKCAKVQSIDDVEDWKATRKAMNTLGLTKEEQENILAITAAVLHLQNIEFVNNIEENAQIKSWDLVNMVASILSLDPEALAKTMTTRTRVIMNKEIVSPCTIDVAIDIRNTLTKAIYSSLFNWLISRINSRLSASSFHSFIGLLDIFGFETFETNSFEQLCINYANETLQYHYNDYNFKRDIQECKNEGIDVTSVVFRDNTPCIELIQGRKGTSGILQFLDEQCTFPKSTDKSFLSLIVKNFSSHSNFSTDRLKHSEFYVDHFAGRVEYNVDGWLDKNKDELKPDILQTLRSSKNKFIADLVQDPPVVNRKTVTVGGSFRMQLSELMEVINSTTPHWVRCIKSHPAKQPDILHGSEVMEQLLSSGVLETIKIRREGFCFRLSHREFVELYAIIIGEGKDTALNSDLPSKCKEILSHMQFTTEQAQVGKTKVFLRIQPKAALDEEKVRIQNGLVLVLQKYARMKMFALEFEVERERILAERRRKAIQQHQEMFLLISQLKLERQFILKEIDHNLKRDELVTNNPEHIENRVKLLEVCRLRNEVQRKEKILEIQRRKEEALQIQREREEALERMRIERENFEREQREKQRQALLDAERQRKEEEERREMEVQQAWEREQQLKLLQKRKARIEERKAKLEKIRLDRERVEQERVDGFLRAKKQFEQEQLEREKAREIEIREKREKDKKFETIKKQFAEQELIRYTEVLDAEDSAIEQKRKRELAKRFHIDELRKQEYITHEAKTKDLRLKEKKNSLLLQQLRLAQISEIEEMTRRREEKRDRVREIRSEMEEEQERMVEQMTMRQELEKISQKIQDDLQKKRQQLRAQAEAKHKRLMKMNHEEFRKVVEQRIYEEEMTFSKEKIELQSKIDTVMKSIRSPTSPSRVRMTSPSSRGALISPPKPRIHSPAARLVSPIRISTSGFPSPNRPSSTSRDHLYSDYSQMNDNNSTLSSRESVFSSQSSFDGSSISSVQRHLSKPLTNVLKAPNIGYGGRLNHFGFGIYSSDANGNRIQNPPPQPTTVYASSHVNLGSLVGNVESRPTSPRGPRRPSSPQSPRSPRLRSPIRKGSYSTFLT